MRSLTLTNAIFIIMYFYNKKNQENEIEQNILLEMCHNSRFTHGNVAGIYGLRIHKNIV
jgi:hypothetical protein